MDVPDGPVGVVRQRVDRTDRHERALEGRQAVEYGGDHHEAQRRVVAHLVPGAVQASAARCRPRPRTARAA